MNFNLFIQLFCLSTCLEEKTISFFFLENVIVGFLIYTFVLLEMQNLLAHTAYSEFHLSVKWFTCMRNEICHGKAHWWSEEESSLMRRSFGIRGYLEVFWGLLQSNASFVHLLILFCTIKCPFWKVEFIFIV